MNRELLKRVLDSFEGTLESAITYQAADLSEYGIDPSAIPSEDLQEAREILREARQAFEEN